MRSKHATPLTSADLERFDKLWKIGCIACLFEREDGHLTGPADCNGLEIHHQLHAGKRIGHQATIPLGTWHHQGVSDGRANKFMLKTYGPSFHKHTRAFRERYGTDEAVLARVNQLIGD